MRVRSTQPGALPTPCFSQPQPCNSPGVATSSWVWQGKRGLQPFDTRRVTPELCWWAVLLWLFSVTVPNGTERLWKLLRGEALGLSVCFPGQAASEQSIFVHLSTLVELSGEVLSSPRTVAWITSERHQEVTSHDRKGDSHSHIIPEPQN